MSASTRPRPSYLRKTVLIVNPLRSEQEELRRFFAAAGFHVLTTAGDAEAMDLCRNYQGAIHLLVADIQSGGSSGWSLAESVAKLRPGLPVLFLSAANVKNGSTELSRPESASPFSNPFAPHLLAQIAQVLSRRTRIEARRN